MRVELAVFDGLQRRGQQRRDIRRLEHDAIFAVRREDAADEQRLEARNRHFLRLAVRQSSDDALRTS